MVSRLETSALSSSVRVPISMWVSSVSRALLGTAGRLRSGADRLSVYRVNVMDIRIHATPSQVCEILAVLAIK